MKKVTRAELEAMDRDSDRCAGELSDARVDVVGYACLVAIMSMGQGYHRTSEDRLSDIMADNGSPARVVTSAGALIHGLCTLGARKISLIAPYTQSLTNLVCDYIEAEGVAVHDRIALEIEDNVEVGRRDPLALVEIAHRLDIRGIDAIVLSACVQMPSLAAIPIVERAAGLPVISSAVCTAFQMLERLGLQPVAPGAGALLAARCGVEERTHS